MWISSKIWPVIFTKIFPVSCGFCREPEGRGGVNLQKPYPWTPPPPQTWIFAEIDRGDRQGVVLLYINAGFIRISGEEAVSGAFINPAFWG